MASLRPTAPSWASPNDSHDGASLSPTIYITEEGFQDSLAPRNTRPTSWPIPYNDHNRTSLSPRVASRQRDTPHNPFQTDFHSPSERNAGRWLNSVVSRPIWSLEQPRNNVVGNHSASHPATSQQPQLQANSDSPTTLLEPRWAPRPTPVEGNLIIGQTHFVEDFESQLTWRMIESLVSKWPEEDRVAFYEQNALKLWSLVRLSHLDALRHFTFGRWMQDERGRGDWQKNEAYRRRAYIQGFAQAIRDRRVLPRVLSMDNPNEWGAGKHGHVFLDRGLVDLKETTEEEFELVYGMRFGHIPSLLNPVKGNERHPSVLDVADALNGYFDLQLLLAYPANPDMFDIQDQLRRVDEVHRRMRFYVQCLDDWAKLTEWSTSMDNKKQQALKDLRLSLHSVWL